MKTSVFTVGLCVLLSHVVSAQSRDPNKVLEEAERLAWLKAWVQAAPLYTEAERLFTARNDTRNALYAQINKLRGELHRRSVPEVSQRLAEYLDDPIVQRDKQVRLRCLVIKGEADEDLDPVKAERAWREAADIARELGDARWANRAQGELGVVAYMQGDISAAVIQLGQALKTAEANGDAPSQIRWLTLFGMGYIQLGRAEQALTLFDRALSVASTIPELQTPVMTFFAKGDALRQLGRVDEAERVLKDALAVAAKHGALGHQAEINMQLAMVAFERKQEQHALQLLLTARDLARRAGGNRILAEIALQLSRRQRASGRTADADATLREGLTVAHQMQERILTPQLLARLAELRIENRRYGDARTFLDEASDLLEGVLANVSSPWVRSQLLGVMSDVYETRIRLEGSQRSAAQMWTVLEQVRARSLLELLLARPVGELQKPQELRAGERAIAALQLRLYRTRGRDERQRLLDQIFETEERLAPISTALFDKTRHRARRPLVLADVQRALRPDEILVSFAALEPESYRLVVTRTAARLQPLPSRTALQKVIDPLMQKVRDGGDLTKEAANTGAALLANFPELSAHSRLIVSPDTPLHGVPIELLRTGDGRQLLETHIVSYVPSGSVLAVLRGRVDRQVPPRAVLAVGASPTPATGSNGARQPGVTRNVYNLELAQLPPLPAANDEARAVASILGGPNATVLVGESATEAQLKNQPLSEFRVLHFAGHAIPSIKFPARAALLFSEGTTGSTEDGLWQAREILTQTLKADLVTLSACETGSGAAYGQEGVATLVKPFLASGARAVVANLWDAEDTFSLALMREFYRALSTGTDAATALQRAKLNLLRQFGSNAAPRLWSGVVVYGDGTSTATTMATSRVGR